MLRKLETEFSFAGFNFPRYIADLPDYSGYFMPRIDALYAALHARRESRKSVGPSYTRPTPNAKGRSVGFYLEEDNAHGLRIIDSECGSYTDPESDTTFNGLVVRLPKSRGYLAGWTMGIGMASTLDVHVFDELTAAESAAENLAESACWEEAQYQRVQSQLAEIETLIEMHIDEFRAIRENHSAHVIAAIYSRGPSVARRWKSARALRKEAALKADMIRTLRQRIIDNAIRTGV